ncbi:MAG: MlaD family protein [Bacteriovoracaceae bacterium]
MNEFKVGLLALASLISVVYMTLRVTSNQAGFGEFVKYRTIINDAAGIFPKTPIKIAGITSGRILNIELLGNQALVSFEVTKQVTINKSSILKVKTIGFLGDKYLEIIVGEGSDRLPASALIPSESGGGLEDLTKDASDILKDLKAVIASVKQSVSPNSEDKPLVDIINNLRDVTKNTKDITAKVKDIVDFNESKINKIIANVENLTTSLEHEMDTAYSGSLISDVKQIGPVLANAKKISEDLKKIIEDVKAGKGSIGKLLRDDEIVDQVSETLAGVNKLVNKVDSIRTQLSIYTSVNSISSNKSEAALSLFPAPERFYLLGITTSEFGPKKETLTKKSIGGTTQEEYREETIKNTYRFNVQIGRAIHGWKFRVGLIESTGGLGIDYLFEEYGTILSLEAFDYRKSLGPNLRFSSQIRIWNVFYGRIAFEDLVSKSGHQSYTLGAGLRFTDEDLKGLIGFFF